MSFSSETKAALIALSPKSKCCRRAILNGALMYAPQKKFSGEITEYLETLLHETAAPSSKKHPVNPPQPLTLQDAAYPQNVAEAAAQYKCMNCGGAFARGVFLARGFLSPPDDSYRIEFSFQSEEHCRDFLAFSEENAFPFKQSKRRNSYILYTKNSTVIEDFLAFIGAGTAVFELANSKIVREIRNQTNRAVNCDSANIAKALSASGRHIDAIRTLEKYHLLDTLPPDLEMTARLRLEFDQISLAELGKKMEPPISKSGMNHRLEKLCELAKQAEERNNAT